MAFKHSDFTYDPHTGNLSLTRNEVTVLIERDVHAESPHQWGNDDVFLVAFNRYFSVHREGYRSFEEARETTQREGKVLFPLSAHIHSGIHLYLGTHKTCQWDSGMVGYIVVDPNDIPKPEAAAEALVATWNTYCSGDVYSVCAEHPASDVESCFDIYGLDAALAQAHEFYESLVQPIQPMLKTCPPQVYWTC